MKTVIIGSSPLGHLATTRGYLEQVGVQSTTGVMPPTVVIIDDTPKIDPDALSALCDATFTFHPKGTKPDHPPSTFYKGLPKYRNRK